MSKIPRINNFAELVENGIGQPVSVFIKDNDPLMGRVLHPSHYMVDSSVEYVFRTLGIVGDRDLESLCKAVARISVGRLALSQGFVVEPGPVMNPTERIDVSLRSEEPPTRTAAVDRS